MDLNNLSRHDLEAIEEMNACGTCGGCTDEHYDGYGRCVCCRDCGGSMDGEARRYGLCICDRDGQAPTATETRESARDRIPTVPGGVPVTMRQLVWGDELDAELAQHAEAGR